MKSMKDMKGDAERKQRRSFDMITGFSGMGGDNHGGSG